MRISKRLCRAAVTVIVLACLVLSMAAPALAVSVSSFGDISGSAWYYDAVSFVTNKGLFQGTSSTAFSPNGSMTRGMFITVLGRYASVNAAAWRAGTITGSGVNMRSGPDTSYSVVTVLNQGTSVTIEGKSGSWYKVTVGGSTGYVSGDYVSARYHTFSDVGFGEYYAGYAVWAFERGIINGDGSADRFSPNQNVTREQACTILSRFASVMGLSLASKVSTTTFSDDSRISSWAKDSVYTMQRSGIVQGKENGMFSPSGSTTRAEAAAMLQRFDAAAGGYIPPAANPGTGTGSGSNTGTGQGSTSSPSATPAVPDPSTVADTPANIVSGTVGLPSRIIRVGLLVSTQQFSTCVKTVTLTNTNGTGFAYGSMNDARSFVSAGNINETTIKITTDGTNFTVTGASGAALYTGPAPLAIHPVSSGKAITSVNGEYKYNGDFELRQAYYVPGSITVINYVDVEDYVKGVIPYEFSNAWPVETLKAAAIVSRSHIMTANRNAYAQYGMDIVCNDGSQLYQGRGRTVSESYFATSDAAVDATANLYLTYGGKICTGFFSSSDGGATEDGAHIFGGNYGYLVGKLDPYEQAAKGQISNYTYSITNARTGSTMKALASSLGLGTIAKDGIKVNTYPATGNVESVVITDENGKSATIGFGTSVDRWGFLSKFGFTAYSYRYMVTYDAASDSFTCTRLGWGHNVGMSQWGAYAMAQYYGKNYQQILGFYFTGTSLQYGA